VDSALWLETSHALIKLYRQRIATLDKSISDAPPPPRNKRGGVQGSQQQHGVVEYRKVVQKFRSFLSAEESFYSDLAIRLVRTYGLDEAKPALAALSIQIPSDTASSSAEPSRSALTFSNIPTSPLSTSAREKKLLMVHKALICLGDLARYREQYNEAGGRPKAGKDAHEDGSIRGKGRDGGQQQQPPQAGPRPRNYAKSAEYYLQARLLIPENGNPSNQLAILAMYARDSFGSVLNYYRAICIRLPFPTAKDNLEKTLVKAIDKYKKDGERVESGGGEETKVEVFKEDVVVLHGLWFLKARFVTLLLE
jgi:protein SMG7